MIGIIRMKKYVYVFFLILFLLSFGLEAKSSSGDQNNFPNKPIKIIVYTGPGGLIDVTSRKFAEVASHYTDATFVVENKPGAGGIVALKKVLQLSPDGYTLYACTKSNISKFIETGGESYIDEMDWLALLMMDPECVITNQQNNLHTWNAILENARQSQEKQIWVGPATGGLDHVTAMKIWDAYGINEKWVPYSSGGKAIAALLGKQGVAYVGNPREILGNDDLMIAAVCSSERLPQFPDVPTFKELDGQGLENEYMWRGFAIKKGVPEEILAWYQDVFKKVTQDESWRNLWEKGGVQVVYYGSDKFSKIIETDVTDFQYYLKKIDIVKGDDSDFLTSLGRGLNLILLIGVSVVILIGLIILLVRLHKKEIIGQVIIIYFFLSLSIIFYIVSFGFPNVGEVGAAVVPRLWIFALIPLNIYLLIRTLRNKDHIERQKGDMHQVLFFIAFLAVYLVAIMFLGYYISTFLFLFLGMYLLGYRKIMSMVIISIMWIIFSYLIFYRLLYVQLPVGSLVEWIF